MRLARSIGGTLWRNRAAWAARRERDGCPICRRGRPRNLVAVLPTAWVSAPPRAPLPGYVAIVAKRHVVEPFELPASTQLVFWPDVMVRAQAPSGLVSPGQKKYQNH